ncbi:MAG: hypothetical protein L3J82_09930 [Planctomycetes bacterium]|nr:hypothetical protein [Planctomycetota bacterium]
MSFPLYPAPHNGHNGHKSEARNKMTTPEVERLIERLKDSDPAVRLTILF